MPRGGSEQEKNGLEVRVSTLESSLISERGKIVQTFEFPLKESSPERGQLFAVVDLKTELDSGPAVATKLVWDTLSEEYYAPENETPVSALERAVYAARDKLKDLSPTATLELAAAAIRGEVAYLARLGRPAVYLRRGAGVSDLLSGEEAVGVASQIVEEGDALILGSPIFAKNFSSADLPTNEFLDKQFSSGERVAGFAAFLLRFGSSRQAREEAAARSRSSRRVWKKVSRVAAGIGTKARQLLESVKAPRSIKENLTAAWQKRLSHGKELAQDRQEEKKTGSQEQEQVQEQGAKPPQKKFRLPKIPGLSLPRVITVLVIILAVSVAFTTWQQGKKAKAAEFERLLTVAAQSLDEATGLVELSNERAKELLDEARADLLRARDLSPDTSRIDPLLTRADDLFNAIEKITPVGEEDLVYDLNLQATDAEGWSISGSGNLVYVLEGKRLAVFALNFSEELPTTSALVEGGKIGGAEELVAEGGYLYLRGTGNLYRINLASKEVDEPISFDRISKSTALGTYLGNVYLMVPPEEQIYKFWNLPGGYTSARPWVSEVVPMTGAVDMAIDGGIWLLQSDGQILRLSGGERVPFAVSNLSTPMIEPFKIFTQPSLKYLYIIDRGEDRADQVEPRQGRVVVLEKSGNFLRQFKGDVLDNATDLWVSSNEKILYVLVGAKIYRIDL